MTARSIEIVRRAMENAKGDDLERANMAFGRMTPKELEQQHGQSGQTRQQIWDGYRKHRDEWMKANWELEQLL